MADHYPGEIHIGGTIKRAILDELAKQIVATGASLEGFCECTASDESIRDALQEGQTLFLHDYQGRRIEGYEAIISGKSLLWNGKPFSMSKLAEICLKKEGYTSNSVQGPARWYNSDGISVLELWSQLLDRRSRG